MLRILVNTNKNLVFPEEIINVSHFDDYLRVYFQTAKAETRFVRILQQRMRFCQLLGCSSGY